MDVLVLLEECDEDAPGRAAPIGRADGARPVAYVHWVPVDADGVAFGGRAGAGADGREVITLCGDADADRLAVALAAAVEGRRATEPAHPGAVRHLGVWAEAGATGDVAWRDRSSGQLLSRDVDIAAPTLDATARRLLAECGTLIRQTAAKLAMPDWPEGVRRAISFSFPTPADLLAPPLALAGVSGDGLLASLREADGYDEGYDDGH
jgi:hypothetical protein